MEWCFLGTRRPSQRGNLDDKICTLIERLLFFFCMLVSLVPLEHLHTLLPTISDVLKRLINDKKKNWVPYCFIQNSTIDNILNDIHFHGFSLIKTCRFIFYVPLLDCYAIRLNYLCFLLLHLSGKWMDQGLRDHWTDRRCRWPAH
jgi:hypothetical protein